MLRQVFPAPMSTIAEEMAETLARYEGSRQRNGSLIVVREGGRGANYCHFTNNRSASDSGFATEKPFRVYFELSHNFCCVFVVDSQNNPFET